MDYDGGFDFPRTKEIYNIPKLVSLVKHGIDSYYAIANDNLIEEFQPLRVNGEIWPVQMQVTYLDNMWEPGLQFTYNLSKESITPLPTSPD